MGMSKNICLRQFIRRWKRSVRIVKNNKLVKRLALIFLALVVVACVIVPIPYYIEEPGETIDLKELITVNDKKDEDKGSFSLTSVGIRRATVFTAIKSKIEPFHEIISADEPAMMNICRFKNLIWKPLKTLPLSRR